MEQTDKQIYGAPKFVLVAWAFAFLLLLRTVGMAATNLKVVYTVNSTVVLYQG